MPRVSVPQSVSVWSRRTLVKGKIKKMVCKQLVKAPEGLNPDGLITIRKASEITGIPAKTLYTWKDRPGNGLVSYKLGSKVFFKVKELIRWINLHAVLKGY